MTRARLLGGATLAIACFAGVAGPAQAYVRTKAAKSGALMFWNDPCVRMDLMLSSRPPGLTDEAFRLAGNEAAAVWSASRLSCTKVFVSVAASLGTPRKVEKDGVNSVQFRTDFWGRNAIDPEERVPYPTNALAITSVFAESATGRIVDTDVEINNTGPQWADLVANPSLLNNNTHDLQNTLTHEFGHVLGLDHTCDGGGQSNGFNHLKEPVQACPGPFAVQETTMAAIVVPGDTQRRSLSPDDQQAMCEIYPADGERVCSAEGRPVRAGGGCSMTGGGRTNPKSLASWLGLGGLLSLMGVCLRKRRVRTNHS